MTRSATAVDEMRQSFATGAARRLLDDARSRIGADRNDYRLCFGPTNAESRGLGRIAVARTRPMSVV